MNAFTRGPWSLPHFATPEVNCECRYVLMDSHLGAVCSVFVSGEGDDWQAHGDNPKFDEACANARLIAASPELYEALEQIAGIKDEAWVDDYKLLNDAREIARAALSKVKG